MIWKRKGSMSAASRVSTIASGSMLFSSKWAKRAVEKAADGAEGLQIVRHAGVVE